MKENAKKGSGLLLTVCAVLMTVAFIFTGCDNGTTDPGGGGSSGKRTIIIKNVLDEYNNRKITGVMFYDINGGKALLGAGDSTNGPTGWDTTKTVEPGEQIQFTVDLTSFTGNSYNSVLYVNYDGRPVPDTYDESSFRISEPSDARKFNSLTFGFNSLGLYLETYTSQ